MKIDLVGSRNRGLAMGLNEFAGYLAVGLAALATGWVASRYGLQPQPFYMGIAFVAAGLLLSIFCVRETQHHVALAITNHSVPATSAKLTAGEVFWRTTWQDKRLFALSQTGLINNLNDGMAWGLFPVLFAAAKLDLAQIGMLAALYPIVWGVGQVFTGPLSDRFGRRALIIWGMWLQSFAIAVVAATTAPTALFAAMALLGIGTAMVYPTLLAAIGDIAHPVWRGSAVGIYRFWRDIGYTVGALLAGIVADVFGVTEAVMLVALLTFLSGGVSAYFLRSESVAASAEA